MTPRFTITDLITAGLTQIERARGFLDAAKLSEDWLEKMIKGLVERGVLKAEGSARAARYKLKIKGL